MANKKISLTELDFDGIKNGIKDFLRGQEIFQDYDFEGSGLSILLDVLAYNTHYTAIYQNLSVNEMFLDSARKRNSVVSLAKMLGYTPRSARCARAIVNITLNTSTTGPGTIALPAGMAFSVTVEGVVYSFYNRSSYTASGTNSYQFPNVELIGGTPISFRYDVGPGSKYILANENIDISTLTVKVQESATSSNYTTFVYSESILGITGTSNVFWVKEIDDGLYELIFGNDVIGNGLVNGNVVVADYFISDLGATNGARTFSYNGSPILAGGVLSITTTSPAAGGIISEDIDSIRFVAPTIRAAHNRAVTAEDYRALISSNILDIEAITTWGGEDNIPPVYGKVFISAKPVSANVLSDTHKSEIRAFLKLKGMLTVIPEFVDPEYIDIGLNVTVRYDNQITTLAASDIKTLVAANIINYNNTTLKKFDSIFRYSQLSKLIDLSDKSIINNTTTVSIKRSVTPKYNTKSKYIINLGNPIQEAGVPEDAVLTTGFYIPNSSNIHYIVDNGKGALQLFYIDEKHARIITDVNIGNVNYSQGIINILGLQINTIVGATFDFLVKLSSNDVVSSFFQIARLIENDITIKVIADNTVHGDTRGGTNYTFATNRT